MYLKTDGDVVDDQWITTVEIDRFCEILGLIPDAKILDLCCGQGRHSLELARRSFNNVEGIDRSRYLVQKAQEHARNERLSVKFRAGDARKLPYTADTFDVVLLLGNSFGYFETRQDDLQVLKEVFRVLRPWGTILMDVADGDYLLKNYQPRSWEWIDNTLFVCRERALSSDQERLISREIITHISKGVIRDQFYGERLYSQESLAKIMTEVGFSDVLLHGELLTDSKRNQDLGMMGQRILATGQVRKEWTPVNHKVKKGTKHVAVILGDPTKRDPLKPHNVFDDDDFYTIDQMKLALRGLDGYRFTYLDNHETLVRDLTRLNTRIDYVLNLCDEGFRNDPRNELHVPAMLETLGIPYTGSGPQSLAYCYDKSLVRGIAKEMGIPVPQAQLIRPEDGSFDIPFDFPVIVKPNFGDSSFGITTRSVAETTEEIIDAVTEIRRNFGYDKPVLVEELLLGKDLTIGIIGNPTGSYTVFPIVEEDYSVLPEGLPKICGYEAKWDPTSPYWNLRSIQAELSDKTRKSIVGWSTALFERLECRDYVRFDWRLDSSGLPRLLEANPNPGWCWDGHLAKMASNVGIDYPKMLQAILHAAEERLGINKVEYTKDQ